MKHSMVHWNGCQMVAIDCETTGLDPSIHEIIQLAILPLTSNCEPRKDVMPFYIEMAPQRPEAADRKAMEINALKLDEIMKRGHDQEAAKDLLVKWTDGLGLTLDKGGINRCRLIPLGHNYAQHDRAFMIAWLGQELYGELFHFVCRDTMLLAGLLNDIAVMHNEPAPHPRYSLGHLACNMGVTHDRAHDALQDCIVTAEIYKRTIQKGLLA